jgi:hypothetical protein
MAVEDGYGVVGPRSREVARALLDAAAAAGEDPSVVRTTIGGYIAPIKVVKKYEEGLGAAPEEEPEEEDEKSDFPDDSWKNADIKGWAEAHKVDLGDATKKADMLAAIRTAEQEE